MDKLNRRYVTLNAVEGNVDAYSSVSFDFTGTRDKMSLTVNGDHSENKCFFVVVKDGKKFIGFYLGDLVKKSDGKYELKKEHGKLGSTLYTLKDVVAVEVVDKTENKLLYQGITDGKNDFNGKYTIVVDKPVIVKKEEDALVEEMQMLIKDEIKTENYKYEDMMDIEIEEMSFSNKNIGEGIESTGGSGSGGSGGGIGGGSGSGGSGGGIGGGSGGGGSGGGIGGGSGNGGSGGIGGGSGSGGSGGGIGGGSGSGGSGGGIGGGSGSGGTGGGIGGGSGNGNHDHDHNHNHDHNGSGGILHDENCKCHDCKYKIYYEEHNSEDNRNIYEDFEVFSKLYEGYLRSEYFNSVPIVDEQDNVLIIDRLEPTEEVEQSKTLVINTTFRTLEIENEEIEKIEIEKDISSEKVENNVEQSKESKKRSKSVDDFYDNFLGTKGKNKGNSFVDMINHVKREFESIREIMSLSDEEFARRAENEYREPLKEQQGNTNTFALRGLKDLVENRVEFKPFEMQGHEVGWVQIKLNEVVGFFDNYWKLFWEPFVVDAYTENKHLLLGVERVEGKEKYFFGVPAFYSMEVVNKAFDLGFELFEVVGNNLGEITDGVRGYFIKELKPTESYNGSIIRNDKKETALEEININESDIIRFADEIDEDSSRDFSEHDSIKELIDIKTEETEVLDDENNLFLINEIKEINV